MGTLIKTLSNEQLIADTRRLVGQERHLTAQVIAHLEEIGRRRLFAARGHASLFAFCVRELGYSEDQAQVRISAMRLSRDVPEAAGLLETGEVSLSNLARVQSFLRQERKVGKAYSSEKKRELVMAMKGMSKRECERRLSALSPESARIPVKFMPLLSGSLRDDLERIRALWGYHDLTDEELLQRMAQFVLDRVDPERKASKREVVSKGHVPGQVISSVGNQGGESTPSVKVSSDSIPVLSKSPSRHIPASLRRQVWARDQGQCTYQDPETGSKCGSRYALQVDHIRPFAQGGPHELENLRLACRTHNQLYAIRAYGAEKIGRFAS